MSVSRSELGPGLRRHVPSGLPSAFDGRELSDQCLRLASDLGFVRAGVASIEPLEAGRRRLEAFVSAGFHGEMGYLDPAATGRDRHRPRDLWDGARSVLSVALPYPSPAPVQLRRSKTGPPTSRPSAHAATVAHYARGDDYHLVLKERLLALADGLCAVSGRPLISRICVDTAPLLERDLAVRAGFAFIGKNTLCIAPGAGSHFLLGELLVDLELAPTAENDTPEGCGACRSCLDACPTGAFRGAYELDARRCISYLTIESRADIPRELRSLMGNHVFGCDICQSVCPYNQSSKPRPIDEALLPHPRLQTLDLVELLRLGSAQYRKLVAKTALRRATRDQLSRNAAVALGNSGSVEAIAPLSDAARNHRSEQVRAHATWALGHLLRHFGYEQARPDLEALRGSSVSSVVEEAERALAR